MSSSAQCQHTVTALTLTPHAGSVTADSLFSCCDRRRRTAMLFWCTWVSRGPTLEGCQRGASWAGSLTVSPQTAHSFFMSRLYGPICQSCEWMQRRAGWDICGLMVENNDCQKNGLIAEQRSEEGCFPSGGKPESLTGATAVRVSHLTQTTCCVSSKVWQWSCISINCRLA